MRPLLSFLLFFFIFQGQAQLRILHYAETSGFDHQTRNQSFAMFDSLCGELGYILIDDPTGSKFDHPDTLSKFALVIFSNTSGDQILNTSQQQSFETYINNGGSLMGLHAATDTYRHSTANGTLTGTWDFYPETLGGSVQQSPNHVPGTPIYDMYQPISHPTTDKLPDPWTRGEEYYYWENGYFDSSNVVVLMVEATVGAGGVQQSWDSARAVSWARDLPQGGRVFYTSMGHLASAFSSDTLFQQHLYQAIQWILASHAGVGEVDIRWDITYKNGSVRSPTPIEKVEVIDLSGRVIRSIIPPSGSLYQNVPLPPTPAWYLIHVITHGGESVFKVYKP